MHKDDQMTPKERKEALANGKEVDRMPICLFCNVAAPALLGWNAKEATQSAANIAKLQKSIYETYGCDNIGVEYGLHGMAIALGAEMKENIYGPPSIRKPPFHIDKLPALSLDLICIQKDMTVVKCLEAARRIQDQLGKEVDCGMDLPGAFTSVSGLIGVPQLLKALKRKPEQVHKLMQFATDVLVEIAKMFIKEECSISVGDPMASGDIISPAHFREFVLPYARQFTSACERCGQSDVAIHICGNTIHILRDIADCGYQTFSLDNKVDLAYAKQIIGDRMHLLGNVEPVDVMRFGTPKEVKEAVEMCYKKAWDNPCGFTIAPGCDLPWGTPSENINTYMKTSRELQVNVGSDPTPGKPENS